jgi:hypothetical protein
MFTEFTYKAISLNVRLLGGGLKVKRLAPTDSLISLNLNFPAVAVGAWHREEQGVGAWNRYT